MHEHDLTRTFDRVFVTGDIHGDMLDLQDRVESAGAGENDLMILLGDCGFFFSCYYEGSAYRDEARRKHAAKMPCTFLCIQGNHEQPFAQMDAEPVRIYEGDGYYRDGVYFAANGTSFTIGGKRFLAVGGACSIDRQWRLDYGYPWWEREELSQEEFDRILERTEGERYDFILTHTAPYEDMPREAFIKIENAYTNQNSTERNLQRLKAQIEYQTWYAGHFHIDKIAGNIHFLYTMWERLI